MEIRRAGLINDFSFPFDQASSEASWDATLRTSKVSLPSMINNVVD